MHGAMTGLVVRVKPVACPCKADSDAKQTVPTDTRKQGMGRSWALPRQYRNHWHLMPDRQSSNKSHDSPERQIPRGHLPRVDAGLSVLKEEYNCAGPSADAELPLYGCRVML